MNRRTAVYVLGAYAALRIVGLGIRAAGVAYVSPELTPESTVMHAVSVAGDALVVGALTAAVYSVA